MDVDSSKAEAAGEIPKTLDLEKPAHIIPARFKGKISQALSYPLGAEIISRLLSAIFQENEIELRFRKPFQFLRDRGKPYDVISAVYCDRMNLGLSGGPPWQITIAPVPGHRST
jgi:hypothetical protein